ncbi:MAG: hypothetical protein CMH48_10725 [Muricauda sp.]|nr:hypothetical protein [Allomuricauda sp.]MBC31307.1 hypothetical protein [Allomuricauda sp.]
MNSNRIILSNFLGVVFLAATGLTAQKQSKTYKETFNVGDEAVLEINTTHTDIEFETWDKNQVEITAVVEFEGASDEEAKKYFDRPPIEIKGNSREIEVSTPGKNSWAYSFRGENFNFVVPDVEPLFLDLEIPELPEMPELAVMPKMPPMPPMPPMPFKDFDYKAYQKDGDKYLKKWKKEFDKNFDEEYRERFEEWSEEMKERSKEMKQRLEERKEEREKAMEEIRAAREEQRQALQEQREALREQRQAIREQIREEQRNVIISRQKGEAPDVFFFPSDGESKKYKIKKTIKIKMPKSVKLKMNVRHGEVKLAATTKNINASLQYASLLAATIDGEQTNIRASYTPVVVEKWRLGDLKTDYADLVSLKEVDDLVLIANSSSIIIDKVNDRAYVTNHLGDLAINAISNGFSDVNVTVKNGEFSCNLPKTAVSLHLDGTQSTISYPSGLKMSRINNANLVTHEGYLLKPDSGKTITVNSKYSEVVLKD